MRVLLNEEQVVEVNSINGNLEENGTYTVSFEFGDSNEGMQFVYEEISAEEAKERAKKIIKDALEKGFADVSNEPWDMI